jgi:hypothetical protein
MMRRLLALLAVGALLPACGGEKNDPPEPPPIGPAGLTSPALSTRAVFLTWDDPTDAEKGFHVWMRPAGLGDFVVWTSAAKDATSMWVDGLSPDTDYEFYVTSFNDRGDSTTPSPTVAATTQAYAWTQLTNASAPLDTGTAVYVTSGTPRMVVFGGIQGGPGLTDDLFQVDLQTGAQTPITPSTATRPGPRFLPSMVYDSRRDSLIVFGGSVFPADVTTNEVWEFRFATNAWEPLFPTGTPPLERNGHSAVYDPVNGTMMVFGGFEEVNFGVLNDVHRLVLPATGTPSWQSLTVQGTLPVARDRHAAIYDAANARMIVFGGNDDGAGTSGPYTNELSALALNASATVTWTRLSSQLDVPAPRAGLVAVYDSINRHMVVYGGQVESGASELRVWTLSLDANLIWNEITQPGPRPGPRRYASAVFDPVRIRMLLFGGEDTGASDPQTWALEL